MIPYMASINTMIGSLNRENLLVEGNPISGTYTAVGPLLQASTIMDYRGNRALVEEQRLQVTVGQAGILRSRPFTAPQASTTTIVLPVGSMKMELMGIFGLADAGGTIAIGGTVSGTTAVMGAAPVGALGGLCLPLAPPGGGSWGDILLPGEGMTITTSVNTDLTGIVAIRLT